MMSSSTSRAAKRRVKPGGGSVCAWCSCSFQLSTTATAAGMHVGSYEGCRGVLDWACGRRWSRAQV
jgi:hypothetical protein